MSIAPAEIYDSFSRSVGAGSWGTSDSGHAWLNEGTTCSVDGSHGEIDMTTNAPYRQVYIDTDVDQGTCEILTRVRFTGSTSYPVTDFGPVMHRQSNGTFYAAILQGNYAEIALICYVNGTRYEIQRTSKAINKNSYYWVRFRYASGAMKIKVWAQNVVEPTGWDITTTTFDIPGQPATGDPGFFARGTNTPYVAEVTDYYYYTLEDEESSLPLIDSFDRTVTEGFGWMNTGNLWEGNVSADPAITVKGFHGSVSDPGDGLGSVGTSGGGNWNGITGPSVSGDSHTTYLFDFNSTASTLGFRAGIHGTHTVVNGESFVHGYYAEVNGGGTTIRLYRKSTYNGTPTLLATSTPAFTALASNTKYWLKIEYVTGGTIRAKIWADTVSEPGSWTVSIANASPITSGRTFFEVYQSDATSRTCRLYTMQADTVVAATGTTTGNMGTSATTDVSVSYTAAYTNDTDNDNSITVQYRKKGDPSWISYGGATSVNRTSKIWSFTIGGYEPATAYEARVTFTDPDGVSGTNPRTLTVTTFSNGLDAGQATITSIGSTNATVVATYSRDNDNDSSASLETRTISSTQTLTYDSFPGVAGTNLTSHAPNTGGNWYRSTPYATLLAIANNRVYSKGGTGIALYYTDPFPVGTEYEIEARLHVVTRQGDAGVVGRYSESANDYYLMQYSSSNLAWELWKIDNNVSTLLKRVTTTLEVNDIANFKLVIKDSYKAMEVDGIEIARSTDNAVSLSSATGIRFQNMTSGTSGTNLQLSEYKVTYRTSPGSWVSKGAMTKDNVLKTFTLNATGLTSDQVHEFRVTYVDPDGVTGANPVSIYGQTVGQVTQLLAISATTQETTANISVTYAYDTNANNSLLIQYRALRDTMWTTVPASNISVNRTSKYFYTTLTGLLPDNTYELSAYVTDPDGILQDTTVTLTRTITTKGSINEQSLRTKRYLWKVYDPTGDYLGTWWDAGQPEFAINENGGVSDLTVTLNRPLTDIHSTGKTINFQNRVDIWAVDSFLGGFGPNLATPNSMSIGMWSLTTGWSVDATGGADGGDSLYFSSTSSTVRTIRSEVIYPKSSVPMVFSVLTKAKGGKVKVYVEAYNDNEVQFEQSDEYGESVGSDWQRIRITYTPPPNTNYLRLAIENIGSGNMWVDQFEAYVKEAKIYTGRIESFAPKLDQRGESVTIQILGLVSLLSDDYIDHLQYVTTQPVKDLDAGLPNNGPEDPAQMMRDSIDLARKQNKNFTLNYSDSSIHNTGVDVEYTFRYQQLRPVFDKQRSLCPPGWHYYVDSDDLVYLRGPEHVTTHVLRIGQEIMQFEIDNSIRNLKNYIHVKGRQDADNTETDGFGSIDYVAFDQESINQYGKRVLYVRDANIKDPSTAEIVGDGRLEEYNRPEKRATVYVPDEKNLDFTGGALRGYNIEAFRPGDFVVILDPLSGTKNSYWDQMVWDEDPWDTAAYNPLPEPVPIKKVQYGGDHVVLELSERQPSSVGDFGRLSRYLQLQEADSGE